MARSIGLWYCFPMAYSQITLDKLRNEIPLSELIEEDLRNGIDVDFDADTDIFIYTMTKYDCGFREAVKKLSLRNSYPTEPT
jgi:hypothetical protein